MHRMKTLSAIALFAVVLGCSKTEEAKPAPPAPMGTAPQPAKPEGPAPAIPPVAAAAPAAGIGTIHGKITLEGAAPKMAALPRQTDPVCAKEPMNSNAVVAAADGGLKDVLVRIPVGKAKGPAPTAAASIDQKSCMYHPHVLGVVSGQQISIHNSDATTHNIHTYVGDETIFNEAQPPGAADIKKPIESDAGSVMKLSCDVHKWMEAHVIITDHPFFQVTGDDGSFTLASVPAGTYEIEAWHPHLGGAKKAQVTVEPGKTAEVKISFAATDYKQ